MSKRPAGLVYIGNSINYLSYLPYPFPRGLRIDQKGIKTFLSFLLSMHIDRLGLFSCLHETLLNCITMWQGSWDGDTALCMKIGSAVP